MSVAAIGEIQPYERNNFQNPFNPAVDPDKAKTFAESFLKQWEERGFEEGFWEKKEVDAFVDDLVNRWCGTKEKTEDNHAIFLDFMQKVTDLFQQKLLTEKELEKAKNIFLSTAKNYIHAIPYKTSLHVLIASKKTDLIAPWLEEVKKRVSQIGFALFLMIPEEFKEDHDGQSCFMRVSPLELAQKLKLNSVVEDLHRFGVTIKND